MTRVFLILVLSLQLRAGVLVNVGAGLGIAGQAINLGQTIHAMKVAGKAAKKVFKGKPKVPKK